MSGAGRILLVDDEKKLRETLQLILGEAGFYVETKGGGGEAFQRLKEEYFDLLITDYKMPDLDGLELLSKVKELDYLITVIFITAYADIDNAVSAMRLGAYDYLEKSFTTGELLTTVEKGIKHQTLLMKNQKLKRRLLPQADFGCIIGDSPAMKEVFHRIERMALRDVTVLIRGESGTGKELIARAIHENSKRQEGPFIVINCAALPENLLESELFGHTRGSFTGAYRDKVGKFEQAHGGTLLLDEIGEMSLNLQTKLLRVLQEREVERVGGLDGIHIDVRVLAATNRDLEEAIQKKEFREDLYYRLNVVPILAPPLRERKEDIPLLAEHYLHLFNQEYGCHLKYLSLEVLDILVRYRWPGNVRELKNVIERAVAMSGQGEEILTPSLLAIRSEPVNRGEKIEDGASLAQMERQHIINILKRVEGNKSRAAEVLGINRQTLYNKIRGYQITLD